jgi:hypothetical protein
VLDAHDGQPRGREPAGHLLATDAHPDNDDIDLVRHPGNPLR